MSTEIITTEEILEIFERAARLRSGRLSVGTPDQQTIDKVKEALDQPIYYLGEDETDSRGCSWSKKIRCAAALAAAVAACGGPVDIPCIIAVLGSMADCIDCL